MSQIAQLTQALGDFGFRDGEGGILIDPTKGGVHLYAMSPKNIPRHWTADELAHLELILPKIPNRRFGTALSNEETRRRAEFLEERRKQYTNIKSLDPDGRSIPATGAKIEASKLPRLYAGVDLKAKTLAIFGSEYPIPGTGLRGDELVFEVDLDKNSLEKAKAGRLDIRKLLATAEFSGARVLYYDDNLPERSTKARRHHLKSMDTLAVFTRNMIVNFKMTIVGELTQIAQDEWLEARRYFVGQSGRISSTRMAAEGSNFSFMIVRGINFMNGKEMAWPTKPLVKKLTFLDSMSEYQKRLLREAANKFGRHKIAGRRR